MSDYNAGIRELYRAVYWAEYPPLAWMVRRENRLHELWRRATDDTYMRMVLYVIDEDLFASVDLLCAKDCDRPDCEGCSRRCVEAMPRLPSVLEIIERRKKQLCKT